MSNAKPVDVYFGNLRELIRHAEAMSGGAHRDFADEYDKSSGLYEKQALENVIGEMGCLINECERRIRYLETVLGNGF